MFISSKAPLLTVLHAVRHAAVAALLTLSAFAQNPLNLTPGIAANKVLGSIANPGAYDLTTGNSQISYNNADLATRTYLVRLPAGFDPADATKKYGVITSVESGDSPSIPSGYAATLDEYNLIWIAGHGIGNVNLGDLRCGVALMGVFRLRELYPSIDPRQIFVSGSSGGARASNELIYERRDVFRGALPRIGASIPGTIPGWSVGGRLDNADTSDDLDSNYENIGGTTPLALAPHLRTALFTAATDFRRAEVLGIYRYGHLNPQNTTRAIFGSGGHADPGADNFREMVDFLYHPLRDVVWDRFGDGLSTTNSDANAVLAGPGFVVTQGTASETTLSYNTKNHGVLELSAGSAVLSPAGVAWRDRFGAFVDARLRASSASATNQLVGLHLVAPGSASGTPGDRPGFHVLRGYGVPSRLDLVSASGTRRTLATWNFAGTHPMSLPADDKTFWNNPTDEGFRGEFVRLFVNAVGFQITFHRPITDFATSHGVTLGSTDTSPLNPNETFPILIQGSWATVGFDLLHSLGYQELQLALSNQPANTSLAAGTALVDEVRVVAPNGLLAAPALSATLGSPSTTHQLSWTPLAGAFGYSLQTAAQPDGPFTEITRPGLGVTTFSRTAAPNGVYYRVAGLSASGAPGRFSVPVFAGTGVPPTAPTNAAVSYPSGSVVRITWSDGAANESGYRVERRLAAPGPWQTIASALPANTTSFDDSGAVPGVAFVYRVTAFGLTGISAPAVVTATLPGVRPAQPIPGAFQAGLEAQGIIGLSWTDSGLDRHSYRLERSVSGSGQWSILSDSIAPDSTAFFDTTGVPGVSYDYRLSAVGPGGTSGFATVSLAIPASTWVLSDIGNTPVLPGSAPALPPANPVTLEGRAGSSGTGGTTGGTFLQGNDNLTFAFRAWTGDVILTSRIVSFANSDGNGRVGIVIRETDTAGSRYAATTIKQGPQARSLFRVVTNGNTLDSTYFATAEVARTFPQWVRLIRQGDTVRSYFSADGVTWTQDGPSRTFTTLPATLYAGLFSSPGRGGNTSTAVFENTTLHGLPAAPASPAATPNPATGAIQLAWSALQGSDTYTVRRALAADGPWTVVTTTTATAFTDVSPPVGQPVFYTLSATNLLGEGPPSAPISAQLLSALQSWRQTHFGTSANAGSAANATDFDGDGVSNLLEYALGTLPASAASVSVPTSQVSGLRLQLSFLRARPDVTYVVEASSDLSPGSWTPLATDPGTVGQSVTVTDTVDLPTANPPRRFLRLRVIAP